MNVIYKLLHQSQNFNANSILFNLQNDTKLSDKDLSVCMEILSYSTSENVLQLILKELLSILEEGGGEDEISKRRFFECDNATHRETENFKLVERCTEAIRLAEIQTSTLAKVLSSALCVADTDDLRFFNMRLILKYSKSELFADEFMQSCNQNSFSSVFDTRNVPLRRASIQAVQKLLESSFRREMVTSTLISILMDSFGHYCYGETSVEWLLLFSKFTSMEELAKEFVRRGGLRIILSMLKIKHMNIVFQSILILMNLARFGLIQSAEFSKSTRQQLINFLSTVTPKESKPKVVTAKVPSVAKIIKKKVLNILDTNPHRPAVTPIPSSNLTQKKNLQMSDHSSSESLPNLPKVIPIVDSKETKMSAHIPKLSRKSEKLSKMPNTQTTPNPRPENKREGKKSKEKVKSLIDPKPLTPKSPKKQSELPKSSMSFKQSSFSLNNRFSEMSVHQLELEVEHFQTPDPKIQIDEELQNLIITLIGSMNSENLPTRLDAIYQLQRILSSSEISVSLCKILSENVIDRLSDDVRITLQTCKMLFYLSGKEAMQQVLFETEIIAKLVEIIGGYNLVCIEHALWALLPYCNSVRRVKELTELEIIPKLAVVLNSGIENIRVYCQTLLKKIAEYGDENICKEMDYALLENPWAVVSKKWIDYSPFSPYSKKRQTEA
ncbi:hypothetical protein HDV06_000098 [Boothiomyces sp. JEL0866]|nr:hypothetical protein HDV06_000098 [Boothiomyces sp. JEL0866]